MTNTGAEVPPYGGVFRAFFFGQTGPACLPRHSPNGDDGAGGYGNVVANTTFLSSILTGCARAERYPARECFSPKNRWIMPKCTCTEVFFSL